MPGQVADGGLERGAGLRRPRVVLEADAQDARHRRAAAPEHLEPLPAREAVGDQDRVPLHRADLDRAPGELLDEADGLGRANHVADLDRALEGEGQTGEEVPERFLEREARRRRVMTAEVASSAGRLAREDDLEQDAEGDAEEHEADDLAQERRRRQAALEAGSRCRKPGSRPVGSPTRAAAMPTMNAP